MTEQGLQARVLDRWPVLCVVTHKIKERRHSAKVRGLSKSVTFLLVKYPIKVLSLTWDLTRYI